MADNKPELQRGLEARHIELIAPGHHWRRPVYGAASTLKWAGPSVLLAYIIAGLFVFSSCVQWAKCCSSNRLPVRSPFTRIVI